MILPLNSKIRYSPIEIEPNQVLTFNAIRYCTDICEVSFLRLVGNLSIISEKGITHCFDSPTIFSDVWSIINNAVIFKKLLCQELKVPADNERFKEINKAIKLRNTNQHIAERLSEVFTGSNYPIYGSLSWRKKIDNNEYIISWLHSGTFTNKKEIKTTISNIDDVEFDEIIQRIEFTGIVKEGSKGNYTYREEQISVSKIISELFWWINELDNSLNKLADEANFTELHKNDMIFQFKGQYRDQTDLI